MCKFDSWNDYYQLFKITIMNINTKISKLYNKLDFLQDCDRWVQYREVYKEITELERLRDESYSN